MNEIPILECYRKENDPVHLYTKKCPYCYQEHKHGACYNKDDGIIKGSGDGHRIAHCIPIYNSKKGVIPVTNDPSKGYILKEIK